MRKDFHIPQRTSISESHLRASFTKLPERIDEIKQSSGGVKGKIIIIIDGVDTYKEPSGREESAEWLPAVVSESIKIIYTCNAESECEQTLRNKCKFIQIKNIESKGRKKILNEYLKKFPDMQKSENLKSVKKAIRKNNCFGNPLFLKMFIVWSLSCFPGIPNFILPDFSETSTVVELFQYSIRFFSSFCNNSVVKVLNCLALCKYGLTKEEIGLSAGISLKVTGKVLQIYEVILTKFEDLYSFTNALFRNLIDCQVVKLAREISTTLEEHRNINRIDELLHALWLSNDWKILKDKLRNILVFGYLYRHHTKLDLCRYWVSLEKNNFDPVEEYNKSLEEFVIANRTLKNEDLVAIVMNFFSFFQEYGNFECPKIAVFRNYPLSSPEILEEVNLYEEIKKYPDIFNSEPFSSLLEEERFLVEEGNHNQMREKVLGLEDSRKVSISNCFHYKRWLWIQFPWTILSPAINASLMLATLKSTSLGVSYEKEKEFNDTFMKLVKPETNVRSMIRTRPQTSQSSLNRSSTLQSLAKKIGINTTMLVPDRISDRNSLNTSHSFHRPSSLNFDEKPEPYLMHFSLKDTGINTVLLKLDSQLVKFSQTEYHKKHKEVVELQKNFNKIIEAQRLKEREIVNIETQISQLQARHLEKTEVIQKINSLQHQANKNLEKFIIAQADSEHLKKIYTSCIRNPPFLQEWNNEIIKAIEACKQFISSEHSQIEIYKQDIFEYQNRCSKIKPLISEKKKFETNTLKKLSEKYSLNAYINKNVVKGHNRRKLLLSLPVSLDTTIMLRSKIQVNKTKIVSTKLQLARSHLEKKLAYFENLFQKIQKLTNGEESIGIAGLIGRFQEKAELTQQKNDLEAILEGLKLEKGHLEEKLTYLKALKPSEEVEEEPKSFAAVSDELYWTDNKMNKLHEIVTEEEVNIVKIKEIVNQLWRRLKIGENIEVTNKNAKEIFRSMGDEIEKRSGLPVADTKIEANNGKAKLSKLWNASNKKYLLY